MKLAALQKILGSLKGASKYAGAELGGAAKSLGSLGKGAGQDIALLVADARTGGKFGDLARSALDSAKYTGKGLAGAAKKNPYGTAALGAGALGAGGAGAYGVNELLEELGLADDEDEEEGEDPRHAARARAMRAGMR